ncbi:MAG TPA: FAD-dependent oxidoreductase [Burkholderiales bacterium]|nr:FAD-dependent oxidoreductase [Burkholderiales bacterium]
MSLYEVKLKGHRTVADGTMAFSFSKPDGFVFQAGQAISLELIDPPTEAGQSSRTLSLVSAPFEQELAVATRMRDSAFKRALKALPAGASLRIDGPFGDLTLGETGRPAVFIAGGIGITPFMSMLRQAARDRSPQLLFLAYSNRRPEDSAFLDELQELERQNQQFHLMATMTEMSKSARKWSGETDFVDAAMLKRLVGDLAAPIYYVVGPPAMVEAMQWTLEGAGIAADDIRTEEFYGY